MIRTAVPADASRIAEILIFAKRAAYRAIFQNDAVSFGEMQVLPLALAYRDDPAQRENVLVLDSGFVKGMVRACPHAPHSGEAAALEVRELYVDPFFQREGVGRALLDAALTRGRQAGDKTAFLWCLAENAHARAFYARAGFAPTGRTKPEPGTAQLLAEYARPI